MERGSREDGEEGPGSDPGRARRRRWCLRERRSWGHSRAACAEGPEQSTLRGPHTKAHDSQEAPRRSCGALVTECTHSAGHSLRPEPGSRSWAGVRTGLEQVDLGLHGLGRKDWCSGLWAEG